MMMANKVTTNGDVTAASVTVAIDSRSRTSDVIASPVAKLGDGGNRFRPDIEGMRAIAVGLVILLHGYGKPFTGGFVGVDVFFVISGFLITSLLLGEQTKHGQISIQRFYARRVRRILPASTLTVLTTVVVTYYLLGFLSGNEVAGAAKWTAVFSANIHFALIGTDYLGSQLPPSPLQHMWSLGVEEQFYVVWPGLFLALTVIVRLLGRRNVVHVLAASLLVVIAASLAWSVVQTSSNATWAYFSPLTRAWELALGALIAVIGPAASRLATTWVYQLAALLGLAGIVLSALILTSSTPYPGWAVAIPVVSSALLIWAGCGDADSHRPRSIRAPDAMVRGAVLFALSMALADSGRRCPICRASAEYVAKLRIGFGDHRGIGDHIPAGRESCAQLRCLEVSDETDFGDRSRPDLVDGRPSAVADCIALRDLEPIDREWFPIMNLISQGSVNGCAKTQTIASEELSVTSNSATHTTMLGSHHHRRDVVVSRALRYLAPAALGGVGVRVADPPRSHVKG
jgi:peptidoglycan/LPS O-acetylase OafA/YrhL